MGLHLVVADAVEVKALDAREDGCKNFLRVGGAHDEHNVLGRLLEGLEQGVEGRRGQHVDLVDDVDLAASKRGRVVHAGENLLADVVHAGAGCRVELGHVRVLSGGDETALVAGAVRKLAGAFLAHEGLGEQARHGSLARAARAAEEVGVAGTALDDGALERLHDVLLTNYLLKRLRAVLCVERFHAASRRSVCWRTSIPAGARQAGTSTQAARGRRVAAQRRAGERKSMAIRFRADSRSARDVVKAPNLVQNAASCE